MYCHHSTLKGLQSASLSLTSQTSQHNVFFKLSTLFMMIIVAIRCWQVCTRSKIFPCFHHAACSVPPQVHQQCWFHIRGDNTDEDLRDLQPSSFQPAPFYFITPQRCQQDIWAYTSPGTVILLSPRHVLMCGYEQAARKRRQGYLQDVFADKILLSWNNLKISSLFLSAGGVHQMVYNKSAARLAYCRTVLHYQFYKAPNLLAELP